MDHLDLTLVDDLSPYLSTYPIRHPLWLSMSCGNQSSTVQRFSPHKCGQKSSRSAFNASSSFSLDIFGFPSFSYVHEARPYYWSFLEGHSNCWNTCLSCIHHIWGGVPPRTTFHSFLTHETLNWLLLSAITIGKKKINFNSGFKLELINYLSNKICCKNIMDLTLLKSFLGDWFKELSQTKLKLDIP